MNGKKIFNLFYAHASMYCKKNKKICVTFYINTLHARVLRTGDKSSLNLNLNNFPVDFYNIIKIQQYAYYNRIL